jgi:biotin carboxyl carrier protein
MSTTFRACLYFCLFTGIGSISLSCKNTTATSEDAPVVKTPVTVVQVSFKPVTSAVDLPAVTTFMNKSIIRASTTGIIENISINPGDIVKADELLFTIRTKEAMALNNVAGKDSSLSFKGLININSHNDGVISSISYRKGDYVQEGDELASVSEQNSLVFILDVPFELNRYIEKNRSCVITLPDDNKINGTITGKLPEMDIQSQTVRYVVKPSAAVRLPGNLIGSIRLVRSTNNNALVLPKLAVLGDETQTEFWVMKLINDSTAIKVEVRKGFENNDEVEITDPKFLVSDMIILTGNYGLQDTARVSIIKE